ncbi:MAG: hypothetical protein WA790_02580 [Sulfitobacter sp.]
MTVTDLIDQLEEIEARHGDLNVEFDNGVAVRDVDAIYTEESVGSKPTSIVIK